MYKQCKCIWSEYVGGITGSFREYDKNANSYLIACGSTEKATIEASASDSYAGGITGDTTDDPKHENAFSYIIACYSTSAIEAKNIGTIVGYSNYGTTIIATWVKNNGANNFEGNSPANQSHTTLYNYSNLNEIEDSDIIQMNQSIATYNETEGVEQTCPYEWQLVSGDWPKLVATSSNN